MRTHVRDQEIGSVYLGPPVDGDSDAGEQAEDTKSCPFKLAEQSRRRVVCLNVVRRGDRKPAARCVRAPRAFVRRKRRDGNDGGQNERPIADGARRRRLAGS